MEKDTRTSTGPRAEPWAMTEPPALTRRALLGRGAAVGLFSTLAGARPASAGAALATLARRPVPLPSPRQVRADFERMVAFGPRLTASHAHEPAAGPSRI